VHPGESQDPGFLVAFYVYILASQRNGTLYIGQTDDLYRRVTEHRAHSLGGFTAKYDVTRLVYHEAHEAREEAFVRERQMKFWKRRWKIELIERFNPGWRDLFEDFGEEQKNPGSWLSPG
jgi:putative endonuclease